MSNTKQKKTALSLLLVSALILPLASPLIVPKPAQANPFKGLFSGILKTVKGSGISIVKTAISNPVGTFRLLNERAFKIKGTEKYLKHYDKYGKYLKYVPGIGGQPIPPSLIIDIASKEAGLKNGLPTDLNSILDEILGPSKTKTANGSSGCFSAVNSCGDDKYATLLEQIEREAVIASTGPLGIPDPSVVRATIKESSKRGVKPDLFLNNPVIATTYAGNQSDRKVVRAKTRAVFSEEGQQNAIDRMTAVDEGLVGVVETATAGMEATNTQDVVKSLLSVAAQQSGFFAMQTIADEKAAIDRALMLNQSANSGQTQDALRRKHDVESSATAVRLLQQSRRRFKY